MKLFTPLLLLISVIVLVSFSNVKEGGNQYFNDTIPKPKVYTLTYEKNSLYTNLDSLSYMGRYIGSNLDKDSWLQVITAFNRVLGRVAQSGKLDSLTIKK